jgi:hypothetical protein
MNLLKGAPNIFLWEWMKTQWGDEASWSILLGDITACRAVLVRADRVPVSWTVSFIYSWRLIHWNPICKRLWPTLPERNHLLGQVGECLHFVDFSSELSLFKNSLRTWMQEGHVSSTHYLNDWLWWNINVLSNVLYERSFEARNNIVTESAIETCWNTVNNLKCISSLAENTRLLFYLWKLNAQTWGGGRLHEAYWSNTWVTTKRLVVVGGVVYFVTCFGQVYHLQVTCESLWRKLWTGSTIKRNEASFLNQIFLLYKVMLQK